MVSSLSKKVILFIVLISVVGLGLFLLQSAPKVRTVSKDTLISLHFISGEKLRYKMLSKTNILPSASNIFVKKINLDLEGDLEVVVYKEEGTVYLGMQFEKLDFIVHKANGDTKVKADKNLLEPFLVTLVDGAKIDDVYFSNALDEQEKKQLLGLVYNFQIAFKKDTKRWLESEKNANGHYKANYSFSHQGNFLAIKKENIEYTSYSSQESEIEILKSEISATVDKQSWLQSLNFKEEELFSARDKVMMRAQFTTELHRVQSVNNKLVLHTFFTAQELRNYLNSSAKKSHNSIKSIDKLSSKEAVESFFGCMKDGKCNFLDIARNLKAYLLAHPDAYGDVLNMIKDDKYSKYHHRIINMLRDLGTPEAQRALIDVVKGDGFNQSNKTQAAVSIGFLAEPTNETIESLQNLRASGVLGEQESIASYYALGNMASGSQEAYDKIAPAIIEDLKNSNSVSDTVNALGALENSENNDIIKYVKPHLDDSNNAVRRGAVEALRLTDAPEATEALYNQLQKENYDLVVNSIAFSLTKKKDLRPEIIKAVAIKSVQKIKKSNDTMMMKSIDFLVEQSKTNQDAKNALKSMMGKNLSLEAKRKIIRGL